MDKLRARFVFSHPLSSETTAFWEALVGRGNRFLPREDLNPPHPPWAVAPCDFTSVQSNPQTFIETLLCVRGYAG